MFDHKRHSNIKNNKILRWRLELAQYDYDIIYRAGKYNGVSDTLPRSYAASMANTALYDIRAFLCHPGITRFHHYIKTKKLLFSPGGRRHCCSLLYLFRSKTKISQATFSTVN